MSAGQESSSENRDAKNHRDTPAAVFMLLCLGSYLCWLFNSFAVRQFIGKIAELSGKYLFP